MKEGKGENFFFIVSNSRTAEISVVREGLNMV